MFRFLCRWLPIVFGCHCRSDRSFHFRGKQFPLCARCTGELMGMAISPFLYLSAGRTIALDLVLMLPMVIDGLIQLKTGYESTNIRRLITGMLFGYALVNVIMATTGMAFEAGIGLAG